MDTPFSLAGETALITGGGTGLGLGIARAFVAAGARVMLVGRRADVLSAAVTELGEAAACEAHDILCFDAMDDLVAKVTRRVGPISILVNNAGIHLKKPALEVTVQEFNAVLQTNLTAAFALTQAFAAPMVERRHGSVLFVASMASLFGIPLVSAYSAAKTAHLGLVRTLAAELSPRGVRVNAVAPGWIDSAMMRNAMDGDPQRRDKVLGRTPLGRFGESQDIGWAATYLSSPAARFVTGVVLPVDGGVSIGF